MTKKPSYGRYICNRCNATVLLRKAAAPVCPVCGTALEGGEDV